MSKDVFMYRDIKNLEIVPISNDEKKRKKLKQPINFRGN